ncbi:MAG: pantetheine-phosphate adenylyltransferase [Spirochaetales bacterium]|nr:pantetheine-phosphate adenylyltransferase [Spirochaetales bacterium]
MLTALFPGSFDPPTLGHTNLIDRCAEIYDKIYVVVAVNSQKTYSFSADERLEMMKKLTLSYSNVEVVAWDKLIVTFAEKVQAKIMIRGVRALTDFNYEFELSMINKGLNRNIETIFMPTDPRYFVLRSSAIKELVRLGGDISEMVPEIIIEEVYDRYRSKVKNRR